MADEKNGKENLTEEQIAAQKVAKRFLQAKSKALRAKATAQKEVKQWEEIHQKRQEKLLEAEKALESFKENDDILKSLAGLETVKNKAKYRDQAASCLFELLDMIRKSDDKEQKSEQQETSEKTNVLPTLHEQIEKINPAGKLFEILKESTTYDEKTKILSIDGKTLYTMIGKRLAEQDKLMDDAKATYATLEATVEAELELKRDNAEKARKARKKKTTDKPAIDNNSLVADEKDKTADSGEADKQVLEEKAE